MTRVAPYGTWRSPISAEMVSAGGVALSQPLLEDGSVYWREGRPAEGGRSVLMRGAPFSDPEELTPEGFDVRTTVHEYGGGAYLIHRGTAILSNFADQRLYRQDPGADPVPITPESAGRDRYTDGRVTPDGRWLNLRPGASPRPRRSVRRDERCGGDSPGRLGGAKGDPLGSRFLLHAEDLARRFDALLARMGSPVDALGRVRGVRRRARR